MAASQSIKQQLVRVAGQWPKDAIRPNHQFSEAITKIAESQPAWSTATAAGASQEVKDGQELVKVLDRLLGNRIAQRFPLSDKTKKPPSMPKHYVHLMDGLKRAERGEREPWYKSLFRFRK